MKYSSVASAAAAFGVASAHTIFVQLEAGGVTNPVSYGIRTPSYDGPITDVSSNDVACNGGPNPTMSSDKIINVQAGSTVRPSYAREVAYACLFTYFPLLFRSTPSGGTHYSRVPET